MKPDKKSNGNQKSGWYFLLMVVFAYVLVAVIDYASVEESVIFSIAILVKVIPVFLIVFVLMGLANLYVRPKKLVNYLGKESGVKGWLIAILAGILSSGPVYVWYPLLAEMRKNGMRESLMATFLYARAVKIPLLPLLVAYFGWFFSILLFIVTIVASVVQGIVMDRIIAVDKS